MLYMVYLVGRLVVFVSSNFFIVMILFLFVVISILFFSNFKFLIKGLRKVIILGFFGLI